MNLVKECDHAHVNNKKDSKKNEVNWKLVHEQAFERVKQLIACNVIFSILIMNNPLRYTLMQMTITKSSNSFTHQTKCMLKWKA